MRRNRAVKIKTIVMQNILHATYNVCIFGTIVIIIIISSSSSSIYYYYYYYYWKLVRVNFDQSCASAARLYMDFIKRNDVSEYKRNGHSLIIQHIDCLITVQEHVLPPPPTLWYILHYPVIRPCVVCSESAKVANIKYEPLTFVNEQRRPRSDCASALSDLSLHWSHMS